MRLMNMFWRRSKGEKARPATRSCNVEPLERRQLLAVTAPRVTSVVADNRGEVLITLSAAVNPATVNRNSVMMLTAGADKRLGSADDERVAATVKWTDSSRRITLRGTIKANTAYRVKLVASRMKTMDGTSIDGEYTGTFPSGNGVAGGNFVCEARYNRSNTPQVRMSCSFGTITLQMLKGDAPLTVANFLSYADAGKYDNIFFTRSIPGFIIQGGSLQINSKNKIIEPTPGPMVQNEFKVSNTAFTVAMAKQGGNPNSATNQFFINLADNSADLDYQNGGFTVFAKLVGTSSQNAALSVADESKIDRVALYNPLTGRGIGPASQTTGLTDVPVKDEGLLSGTVEVTGYQYIEGSQVPIERLVVTGGFNPTRDLQVIRRTAMLMKVYKVG